MATNLSATLISQSENRLSKVVVLVRLGTEHLGCALLSGPLHYDLKLD